MMSKILTKSPEIFCLISFKYKLMDHDFWLRFNFKQSTHALCIILMAP